MPLYGIRIHSTSLSAQHQDYLLLISALKERECCSSTAEHSRIARGGGSPPTTLDYLWCNVMALTCSDVLGRGAGNPLRAQQSTAQQSTEQQSTAQQSRAQKSTEEQSRAQQSRAEQSRAQQSRAEQSRAEQSRAENSRAQQSTAEHNAQVSLAQRRRVSPR